MSGVGILWPRRSGFREDELTVAQVGAYVRSAELPVDDFHTGNWADRIRALLATPAPQGSMAADGATVASRAISGYLAGTA